ncbi:hypothetical protein AYI69_g7309, partial [Smittium culicis]
MEAIKEPNSNKSNDLDRKIEIELDGKEDASETIKKSAPINFKPKESKTTSHL